MKPVRLTFILLLILISCHTKQEKWLEIAQPYIFTKPDSVFYYLDKIKNPEKLAEEDLALYNYIYGTTSLQSWNNPTSSPEKLEKAAAFFIKENDSVKIHSILLELAKYHMYFGRFQECDSLLNKGIQYTNNPITKNFYYQNLSHNAIYQEKYMDAIYYNELALRDSAQLPSYLYKNTLGYRGEIYMYANRPDSALYYYDKILDYSYTEQIYPTIAYYHRKKSELHEKTGNTSAAFDELSKSIEYDKGRYGRAHYQFIKARIHLAAGEKDSAVFYLQKAILTPNVYVAAIAYEYLAHIYSNQEEDSLALATLHLYNNHFDNLEKSRHTARAIEYQEDKLKFENEELKLLKKQREYSILLLSVLSIFICGTIYFIYFREKKKKEQKEAELDKVVLENQIKELEKEKELSLLKERSGALREQIFRQLSVSQKIPSLSKHDNSSDIKTKLTPEELKELVDTVNNIWPGFTQRLQACYPALKEKDLIFCSLIKCGITTKDLSNIYYVTPSAISQKKSRMRKEKFHIQDENITLESLLEHV